MKTIAFRADASVQIGSGHVMRCLTLADAFKTRGAGTLFLCREAEGDLIELIQSRKHSVIPLPRGNFSQKEDAEQCLRALPEKNHCLIADHYGLDAEWEEILKKRAAKMMIIDDLANRPHRCDFLLDPNFYPKSEKRYEKLIPKGCQMFLGPRFALLRPQFMEARKKLRQRSGKVRRVFVSFGGCDASYETGKGLEVLARFENLSADVVAGRNNPHLKKIETFCRQNPRFSLHVNTQNMAELMAQADLALGAGGSTTWERCFLGLPSLVVVLAENQRELTEALAAAGAVKSLGWHKNVAVDTLADAIDQILNDTAALRQMEQRALEIMRENSVDKMVEKIIE